MFQVSTVNETKHGFGAQVFFLFFSFKLKNWLVML